MLGLLLAAALTVPTAEFVVVIRDAAGARTVIKRDGVRGAMLVTRSHLDGADMTATILSVGDGSIDLEIPDQKVLVMRLGDRYTQVPADGYSVSWCLSRAGDRRTDACKTPAGLPVS